MKRVYVTFDDGEHRQLTKAKGNHTWHDFIMTLTRQQQ
jgi:hypothetical protein